MALEPYYVTAIASIEHLSKQYLVLYEDCNDFDKILRKKSIQSKDKPKPLAYYLDPKYLKVDFEVIYTDDSKAVIQIRLNKQ